MSDDDASAEDELESEEQYDTQDISTDDKRKAKHSDFRSMHTTKKQRLENGSSRTGSAWLGPDTASTSKRSSHTVRSIRPKARAEIDLHAPTAASGSTSRLNRRLVLGFADLNTVPGRYVSFLPLVLTWVMGC